MTVGKRIQNARINAGLTQKALAEECGLATGTIQQYELDRRLPKNKEIIEKIAEVLNVSAIYLLWGERHQHALEIFAGANAIEESKKETNFINYLNSLGYTFVDGAWYDAPQDELGMFQIKDQNIELPLSKEEFEKLRDSIENNIDLEIYRLVKEKGL